MDLWAGKMYLVVFIVVILNNYLVESCEFNGVNFTKLDR